MINKQVIAELKSRILLLYRLLNPVVIVPLLRIIRGIPLYVTFLKELSEYKKLDKKKSVKWQNLYPLIFQKTSKTQTDPHYFFQSVWAFRLIQESKVAKHIDIGSKTDFVGLLTTITEVTFIDIRPLDVELENFNSKAGTILSLPYPDKSVESISCLHVIEHIGLGRYGDPINPEGSIKAAKELVRVLAPGGKLYLSLPIGRPQVCFNAHRIHSPSEVLKMFESLELAEFSAVTDNGKYLRFADLNDYNDATYSNGLFLFRASG